MTIRQRSTGGRSTFASITPEPIAAEPRACAFKFQPWNGLDHWKCDLCGLSKFDRDTAFATKCQRDGQPALDPEKSEENSP